MSPHPEITPPPRPILPRQNGEYDLSSFYAALSSINAAYPSNDLSSLLAQYSATYSAYDYASFLQQYTSQAAYDYSSLLNALTAPQTGNAAATGAGTEATNSAFPSNGNEKRLSTGVKIAIGVAVAVALLLLVGLGVFFYCAGKRKGKRKATTIVAPMNQATPPPFQPQPYAPSQGYLPGYQQPPPIQQTPPTQFQQIPPQIQQPHVVDPNAAMGGYAKGPPPGVMELETEYHFARDGAVEIGDSEPAQVVEDKKGWRKMIGRKPVSGS